MWNLFELSDLYRVCVQRNICSAIWDFYVIEEKNIINTCKTTEKIVLLAKRSNLWVCVCVGTWVFHIWIYAKEKMQRDSSAVMPFTLRKNHICFFTSLFQRIFKCRLQRNLYLNEWFQTLLLWTKFNVHIRLQWTSRTSVEYLIHRENVQRFIHREKRRTFWSKH